MHESKYPCRCAPLKVKGQGDPSRADSESRFWCHSTDNLGSTISCCRILLHDDTLVRASFASSTCSWTCARNLARDRRLGDVQRLASSVLQGQIAGRSSIARKSHNCKRSSVNLGPVPMKAFLKRCWSSKIIYFARHRYDTCISLSV